MPTIENLNVGLNMQTSGFTAGIRSATDSLGRFGLASIGVEKLIQGLQSAFNGLANQFKRIDDIADFASNLGISTEELSRLHFAAKQTDSSVEALNAALKRAATSRPGKSFQDLSKEIAGIEDPLERAQRAQQIFGRNWLEINALLKLSQDELRLLGIQSDALGNTIGGGTAGTANDAVNQVQQLTDAWYGFVNVIIDIVGPTLVDFLKAATKGLLELRLIMAEIKGDVELQNKIKITLANVDNPPKFLRGKGGGEPSAATAGRAADVGAASFFTTAGFSAVQGAQELRKLIDVAKQGVAENKKQVEALKAIQRQLALATAASVTL